VNAARSFSETDIHAYLDGEVTEAERAAIEAWFAADAAAADQLKAMRALDQRLKGTFEFVLDEPASKTMQAAVLAHGSRRWRQRAAWIAASLALALCAGGAGYLARGWVDGRSDRPAFVDTALGAHAVFVPEVRHPVEVAATEEDHLVKWLTKRVGAPLRAPNLLPQGFKLVGGRLLADQSIPAAQFMYENAEGQRLTLYARRDASTQDSSFAFSDHAGVSAFTWIDRPLAYALVGKVPRETLQALARTTYEQLQR
jgi:anti-sigma factor RsiW